MGEHADDTMNYDDEPGDHIHGDGGPHDVAIMNYILGRRPQGGSYLEESDDAVLGRLGESTALSMIEDIIRRFHLDATASLQWDDTVGLPLADRIALNRRLGDIALNGWDHRGEPAALTIEVKSTRRYADKGTVSFPRRCFDQCEADLLIGLGFRSDDSVAFCWSRTMESVRRTHGHIDCGEFIVVKEGPGWELADRLCRTFAARW